MKLKILVCSQLFAPSNSIGAVRPTNFAKYLSEFGHEVVVITSGIENVSYCDNYKFKIFRIITKLELKSFHQNDFEKNEVNNNFLNKIISKIKNTSLWLTMSYMKVVYYELKYARSAQNLIKSNFDKGQFDIVISSFSPLSSIFVGHYIKRKSIADFWICDLRDMVVSSNHTNFSNIINRYIENTLYKKANLFTVVSKGQSNLLMKGCNWIKSKGVKVVYNGFDGKKDQNLYETINTNELILTSTGNLYGGKRDLSLLFDAISELINESKISIENIKFFYAGTDYNALIQQIKNKKLQTIVCNKGLVSRIESIKMQSNSDILVLATWNTEKEQGILTGKFYDYLLAERNIIAIVTGSVANAEISELIDFTDTGISCEQARGEDDFRKLKNFILKCYNMKMTHGVIPYNEKIKNIVSFNYFNLTKQLESICSDLVNRQL